MERLPRIAWRGGRESGQQTNLAWMRRVATVGAGAQKVAYCGGLRGVGISLSFAAGIVDFQSDAPISNKIDSILRCGKDLNSDSCGCW